MNNDFTGAQHMDEVKHHDSISLPDSQKRDVSRLREKGHAPYRCTRCFKSKKAGT